MRGIDGGCNSLIALKKVFSHLSAIEKTRYSFLLGLRVVSNLLDVVGIALIVLLANSLSQPGTPQLTVPGTGITFKLEDSFDLFLFVALLTLIFIIKSALSALLLHRTTVLLGRAEASQSRRITAYLFGGTLGRLSLQSRADIQWSVMSSSQAAFNSLLFSFGTVVSETSLLVFIGVALFVVDPLVSGMLLTYFLIIGALFLLLVSRQAIRLGERISRDTAESIEYLSALGSVFREASLSGRLASLTEALFVFRSRLAQDWGFKRFLLASPRFFVEVTLMVGFFLLVTAQLTIGGAFDLPQLGVFLIGGLRLMAATLPIHTAVTEFRVYLPQAKQALRALDLSNQEALKLEETTPLTSRSQKSRSRGKPDTEDALAVAAKNLSFTYPNARSSALQGVSLEVEAGSHHALVGPSGSGKSTLIDCLLGLQPLQSGTTTIAGIPSALFVRDFPGRVGYVSQKPGFIPGTILENITLDKSGFRPDMVQVHRAVSIARLDGVIADLSNGLDTELGRQLDTLSGGQLQRLAIARALYTRPGLLVLDEPTSSLDAKTEAAVSAAIEQLSGSMTVLVIAHRVRSMENASQVHFMTEGKIRASGSFPQLSERVPEFNDYLNRLKLETSTPLE